jgi:hypothetical protein
MNEGWIKLHRQLKEWQHYQEPFVLLVWLDLLLSANMKAGWVRGNRINRGQLITSVARIMESTGIGSDNTVRDALRKLEESGEIKKEQIGIGTKITINHFNKFQTSAQDAQPSAQPTAEVGAQPTAEVGAYPSAEVGADKQEYIEREESKERKEGKEIISSPLPPDGETARKKEKKPKEPPHAVTEYDKAFEAIYSKHTGTPFAWSKRENIACNSIVGKIAAIMVAQGQVPTDDSKLVAFKWFVDKVATKGDDWMRANLTPHVIDSKFNEYYQRIKSQENGTARNNNQNPYGVSPEYLEKLARELGGVL